MNITERRLRAWEHQHLVEPRKTYAFGDLVTLRTLESLRAKKVSTKTIRRIIEVLHGKLRRVRDPLSAARTARHARLLILGKDIRMAPRAHAAAHFGVLRKRDGHENAQVKFQHRSFYFYAKTSNIFL